MSDRILDVDLLAFEHGTASQWAAVVDGVRLCHPTPWTILSPLPGCVTPSNPQRHLPIDAGSLLDQVLWDINLYG